MRVTVKIRHRHEGAAAVLEKADDDELLVTFDQPQRAVLRSGCGLLRWRDCRRRRFGQVRRCTPGVSPASRGRPAPARTGPNASDDNLAIVEDRSLTGSNARCGWSKRHQQFIVVSLLKYRRSSLVAMPDLDCHPHGSGNIIRRDQVETACAEGLV